MISCKDPEDVSLRPASFSLVRLYGAGGQCWGVGAKLLQLCLTVCNPMDHSPPDSSVDGILQA